MACWISFVSAPHCPPRKRLTDPKVRARRVVLPDEQEAFAQRRLQLADIQIFSGGGNAQRGFGVRGDGLPCRRKDTLAVVT